MSKMNDRQREAYEDGYNLGLTGEPYHNPYAGTIFWADFDAGYENGVDDSLWDHYVPYDKD